MFQNHALGRPMANRYYDMQIMRGAKDELNTLPGYIRRAERASLDSRFQAGRGLRCPGIRHSVR